MDALAVQHLMSFVLFFHVSKDTIKSVVAKIRLKSTNVKNVLIAHSLI